eukprot:1624774-Prymnesium_polylepis.2
MLDGQPLKVRGGWTVRCLPLDAAQLNRLDAAASEWHPARAGLKMPAFYRGTFDAEAAADTYLRLPGFEKGSVWVNGFALGRFWEAEGPQRTLYVPGPVVRPGRNELLVFEVDGAHNLTTPQLLPAPLFSPVEHAARPSDRTVAGAPSGRRHLVWPPPRSVKASGTPLRLSALLR